jgi:thioredoxin-like negative regulator of GroEL
MRRSPQLYSGLVVAVMAVVAAGSGLIAWANRPAAREGAAAAVISAATGANVARYTPEAFAAAQAAGQPIVVAIHARWCPTCAAQAPIIQQIAAEGASKNLRVLLVDFDTQKDVVRKLGATMQSTIVVFHGGQEMARTVGDTDPDSLKATIRRTLI